METGVVYDLHAMCLTGDLESIKIRIQPRNINQQDSKGRTPLISALLGEHLAIGKYLIEHKADVNKRDHDGWSALMYASYHNQIDWIELLLQNKANTNLKNSSGMKALHLAQLKGHKGIAEILNTQKPFRFSDQMHCWLHYLINTNKKTFRDQ